MKNSIRTILCLLVILLAAPAFSNFDDESYDSDVKDYIVEIYERFNSKDISQAEFEKYYKQLVQKPSVAQLGAVVSQIHQAAMNSGNSVSHEVFVVSTQRLILGQNPMRLPYGQQMVNDLVLQLDSDQITQQDLLKKLLGHEMARERLGEVLTGTIQTERFAHMKVSKN